jgi:hypothetical protein
MNCCNCWLPVVSTLLRNLPLPLNCEKSDALLSTLEFLMLNWRRGALP